jgi:hypothetical protein
MKLISTDGDLRDKLIKAGNERAKIFTWDKSAERLWKSVEKVMSI